MFSKRQNTYRQAHEFIVKMKQQRFIEQPVVIKHYFIDTDTLREKNKKKNIRTCGVVFIHWPAVNLKRCIATIPGKAYYMVFAIIYRCAFLFNRDVHCANIEDYTNLALLLKEEKKRMFLNCCHLASASKSLVGYSASRWHWRIHRSVILSFVRTHFIGSASMQTLYFTLFFTAFTWRQWLICSRKTSQKTGEKPGNKNQEMWIENYLSNTSMIITSHLLYKTQPQTACYLNTFFVLLCFLGNKQSSPLQNNCRIQQEKCN